MFPNLDTCTRHKIQALQALVAYDILQPTENIQSLVGCSSDQLDITGTGWVFHRPEVCSRTWTHAPEI